MATPKPKATCRSVEVLPGRMTPVPGTGPLPKIKIETHGWWCGTCGRASPGDFTTREAAALDALAHLNAASHPGGQWAIKRCTGFTGTTELKWDQGTDEITLLVV